MVQVSTSSVADTAQTGPSVSECWLWTWQCQIFFFRSHSLHTLCLVGQYDTFTHRTGCQFYSCITWAKTYGCLVTGWRYICKALYLNMLFQYLWVLITKHFFPLHFPLGCCPDNTGSLWCKKTNQKKHKHALLCGTNALWMFLLYIIIYSDRFSPKSVYTAFIGWTVIYTWGLPHVAP